MTCKIERTFVPGKGLQRVGLIPPKILYEYLHRIQQSGNWPDPQLFSNWAARPIASNGNPKRATPRGRARELHLVLLCAPVEAGGKFLAASGVSMTMD